MLVSDQEKDLTETCGLTPDQALSLLQPLHAKIDTEMDNNKNVINPKYLAVCEGTCHCGLYSDLASNKQLKDDLFKKAESFPKKQLIFCAQKTAKWLCNDPLLNTLKTEQEPGPSNGL